MTARRNPNTRFQAYVQFVLGLFYYFLARALAHNGAQRIASDQWVPLVEQALLLFLLLFGYAGVGFSLNGQERPISAQGLPRRAGWLRETGLGLAIGWGAVVLCAAAMAVGGGIAVRFSFSPQSWGWFVADATFFALLALAEEVAFRGYAFQRFARAVGSAGAVIGFAVLYAFLQALQPGASKASAAFAVVFTIVLSTAYLRTRALWVSWGINFGWKATQALLFGLAIGGVNSHSPVVQGDPMGPFWLTGGGFGLDGSWLAFFVFLAAIPVVYGITRDLDFKYNAPELVPAGIPVDLEASARRQHEAAMGEPAPPPLVQIAPVAPANSDTNSQLGHFPEPGRAPDMHTRATPPISGNESE